MENNDLQQKLLEAQFDEYQRWERAYHPYIELGPFLCAPMTLRKLFMLKAAGNAIAMERTHPYASVDYQVKGELAAWAFYDVALYLWVLQESYTLGNKPSRRFKRQVRKWIKRAGYKTAFTILTRYQATLFEDLPSYSSSSSSSSSSKSYTFWLASYIDRIAQAYGWSEPAILDLPITRLLQYHRQITLGECAGRSVPFVTAADKVMVEHLKEVNSQKSEARSQKSEASM